MPPLRDTEPNLFGPARQPDLFGGPPVPAPYRADPARSRARLERLLGELRGAVTMPWENGRLMLMRVVVPQLAADLPDDEGAPLLRAFEAELERLEAA